VKVWDSYPIYALLCILELLHDKVQIVPAVISKQTGIKREGDVINTTFRPLECVVEILGPSCN